MVVTAYAPDLGYYRITFINCIEGTVGIYSMKDVRNVLIKDGDTVGHFLGSELIPGSSVINVMDFNQKYGNNSYFIYEKVSMTMEEIEDKLNLTRGSLHIKGQDGRPIRYTDRKE